jgi:hypothetical protein
MKAYGGVDIYIYVFFTSAPVGDEWSALRPGRLTTGERAPFIRCVRGWLGPRVDLDDLCRKLM